MSQLNAVQAALVKSIRGLSDQEILNLARTGLGEGSARTKSGGNGGGTTAGASRKPRTTIDEATVEKVKAFVHASTGVAVSEVATGCKIEKSIAGLCLKKLVASGDVKTAGERRFMRYAKTVKVAQQAEKAARTPAQLPEGK